MARHYKVDEVLAGISGDERVQYDALLRGPATTVDDLLQWLGEKGFKVSRGAVHNHRKAFDDVLNGVRKASELARAFSDVAKQSGVAGINDAIMGRFQQLQMEWAFAQLGGETLTPEDMERFAKSMNQAAAAASRNQDLRERFDAAMAAMQAKASKKKDSGGGAISVEDIAEARKAIFGS